MEIIINSTLTLADLQKNFHDIFPYLKLEFYAAPHKVGVKPQKLNSAMSLTNCRRSKEEGVLEINICDTVKDIENEFSEKYGLYAQVFRKSGNMWIETNLTDGWTLYQQNKEGKAMSDILKLVERTDFTDRDQWE